jgi:hypothetical protein
VGRASADAPCPANTDEESAAGWSPWAPSYAEWPNGGKGGFVCDRAITWAKDTPPPVADADPTASPEGYCLFIGGTFDADPPDHVVSGLAPTPIAWSCTAPSSVLLSSARFELAMRCGGSIFSGFVYGYDPGIFKCPTDQAI